MTGQHITDEGHFGKYFHILWNMVDDDLDPHQYRLFGHYRRVCGLTGKCTEAIETTAKKCKMGLSKARKTRRELRELGYIDFDESARLGSTTTVTIIDRNKDNIERYSKQTETNPKPPITSDTPIKKGRGVTPIKTDSPPLSKPTGEPLSDSIDKEEPIEEPSKNKDSAQPAIAVASALETAQPIEPETKREGVEPLTDCKNLTSVQERIETPTPVAPPPSPGKVLAAAKPKKPKSDPDLPPASTEVKNELALVCYGTLTAWNYDQNASAMIKAYKACKGPTVDQLKAHQRWWNVNDFRGRKGQRPKPHQVAETWAEFLGSQEGSTNGNTNASSVQTNGFRVPKGFGGRKD